MVLSHKDNEDSMIQEKKTSTIIQMLLAVELGLDTRCNIVCNITGNTDSVATKLCKQGNLIG